METLKILRIDAEDLANNTEPALLLLEVSRDDIERCNIASTLENLLILIDTQENVLRYRASLLFQISGYDEDPRELPEIPEVRRFFFRLTAEWPHWFWFSARGFGALALIMALLCEVKVIREGVSYATEFTDKDGLVNAIKNLFKRGNALFASYPDIPHPLIDEAAQSAIKELLGEQPE